jgi:hypothetical protein
MVTVLPEFQTDSNATAVILATHTADAYRHAPLEINILAFQGIRDRCKPLVTSIPGAAIGDPVSSLYQHQDLGGLLFLLLRL